MNSQKTREQKEAEVKAENETKIKARKEYFDSLFISQPENQKIVKGKPLYEKLLDEKFKKDHQFEKWCTVLGIPLVKLTDVTEFKNNVKACVNALSLHTHSDKNKGVDYTGQFNYVRLAKEYFYSDDFMKDYQKFIPPNTLPKKSTTNESDPWFSLPPGILFPGTEINQGFQPLEAAAITNYNTLYKGTLKNEETVLAYEDSKYILKNNEKVLRDGLTQKVKDIWYQGNRMTLLSRIPEKDVYVLEACAGFWLITANPNDVYLNPGTCVVLVHLYRDYKYNGKQCTIWEIIKNGYVVRAYDGIVLNVGFNNVRV